MVTEPEHIRQSLLDEHAGNLGAALADLCDRYHLCELENDQLRHTVKQMEARHVSRGYVRKRLTSRPVFLDLDNKVEPLDVAKEDSACG
jgi:hypothetical protein